jgi:hypothetical protein
MNFNQSGYGSRNKNSNQIVNSSYIPNYSLKFNKTLSLNSSNTSFLVSSRMVTIPNFSVNNNTSNSSQQVNSVKVSTISKLLTQMQIKYLVKLYKTNNLYKVNKLMIQQIQLHKLIKNLIKL